MDSRIYFFFISFREKKRGRDYARIDTTLKMGLLVSREQSQLLNPLTAPEAGQRERGDS